MDIIQLNYFINIVESDYNLSLAAKKIHVSQPALSQFISNFEKENELKLFHRKNGRLSDLTQAGEQIYQFALRMVDQYEELDKIIRAESSRQKRTVRLGIPSLILRVYFSDYFPNLSIEHSDIHLEIIEGGSNDLRQKLLKGSIDIAILIEPTNLDIEKNEQHIIQIDEMTAFLDMQHPLAKREKLEWNDLKSYPIGTFNKSFMTYPLVLEKLTEVGLESQVKFTSSSWDYLIEATKNKEIISILPRPVEKYFDKNLYSIKHFNDYIPFNFHLCRPIKEKYNTVEEFVFNDIINYFYQPL